ncbi:MAG: hypothetical protein WBG92_22140 [Thiohalocapsa sp.]
MIRRTTPRASSSNIRKILRFRVFGQHWAVVNEILPHLIAAQTTDSAWVAGQVMHTRVDQSAEVAIWLLEIAALAR